MTRILIIGKVLDVKSSFLNVGGDIKYEKDNICTIS